MIIDNHPQIVNIWSVSKDGLYNYALKHTKDQDIAQEIQQQVLMKIYKACCNKTEIRNLRAWLFQVTHNAIIDYQKEQRKLKSIPIKQSLSNDQSVWSDLAFHIEPLIGFLPTKYAIPLELSALKGLKQAEIAQQLNLSLSATKSRILRAKNLLKKEIETCCHLEKRADGQILDFHIKESCKPLQLFKEKQIQNVTCC